MAVREELESKKKQLEEKNIQLKEAAEEVLSLRLGNRQDSILEVR